MIYLSAILVLASLGGILAVLLLIAGRYLANYGPCSIVLNDQEPFVVEGGGKLLDTLYARKVFIPSACGGQGTCGFCTVRITDGGGPVLPTELPFLSPEQLAAGTRLACQVKIKLDITLHVKEEFLNVQEFRARVSSATMVTPDTREIHLALTDPEEIEFRPGQYVQVFVPGQRETTFRAYSVASPPSCKKQIELLVRHIPRGLGSTYLHTVEEGDEVTFTGPYGEFVLDTDVGTELICVGGGCGMAPMRSILRHLGETAPERRCSLFFGARTATDAMYSAEFEALASEAQGLQVHYALSGPGRSPDWQGETGFIHESVARHVSADGKRQAFLCGPPKMIEATMGVLGAKGMTRESIFYDEF